MHHLHIPSCVRPFLTSARCSPPYPTMDATSISTASANQSVHQLCRCSRPALPLRCIHCNISDSGGRSTRADWQSSLNVVTSNTNHAIVNSHDQVPLDLVPDSFPKPLTIVDLSPVPLHGSDLRVAYQGIPGTYSEEAAIMAYPSCEAVPCDQFEATLQAVQFWVADRAVLPIENSLDGPIHCNYDLLLCHHLHIVGEVQLPINHCLLALPSVRKDQLVRIISHPQALSECELTLTKMGINVTREAVNDTAVAAKLVAANNLHDTAAIASARAAELYGLSVLDRRIQDDAGNVTRYHVIWLSCVIIYFSKTRTLRWSDFSSNFIVFFLFI